MKKRLLIAVCGMSFLATVSYAAETTGVLSEDGKTLTVNVDEGTVAEFDSSLLLANVSSVTNVVKTGLGRLDLGEEDDLSAYCGAFTISQGTYCIAASNNLGCVTSSTGVAPVYVKETGAIELKTTIKDKFRLPRKTFYLAGTGPYGDGAIIYNSPDQNGASLGEYVYLTADTLVSVTNAAHIYWNNANGMKVGLNGHNLRVRGHRSKSFIIGYPRLDDPQGGQLIVEGSILQLFNGEGNYFTPYDAGQVVITNSGTLQLSGLPGRFLWGIDVYSNCTLQCAGNWKHTNEVGEINFVNVTNRNLWRGPLRLHQDRTLVNIVKGNNDGSTIGFAGPISGGGIFARKSSKTAVYTPYLHLYCPTNSFTGGLVADTIQLYLWQNGALPAVGGPLMATNSTVMLMDMAYSLPGAIFSGTGSVNNARGGWTGPVTKTETGTLNYNSLVGGGTLDVQQGTFKIEPKESRAKLAGLNEGDIFAGTANAVRVAVAADSTTASAITNRLAMGATALYDVNHRDFWQYDTNVVGHVFRGFTYSGWLWNNTDADETWTFAGVAGTLLSVWVGDTRIFRTGWDGLTLAKAKATLKPGANFFVVTVYNSAPTAPRYSDKITNGVWNVKNFGLGYRKGDWVDDVNVADFSPLMDPGDGSLLTYRRPEDTECPIPGTDWVEPMVNRGATFTNVCVRYGAALDLGGADYAVETLSGVPTIQDCPTFTVRRNLALDVSNLALGRKLQTSGVLAFAPGAQITLDTPLAKVATGDYPLVVATGGVTGAPTLPNTADYRLWRVETTATGVTLKRMPKGTTLYLR